MSGEQTPSFFCAARRRRFIKLVIIVRVFSHASDDSRSSPYKIRRIEGGHRNNNVRIVWDLLQLSHTCLSCLHGYCAGPIHTGNCRVVLCVRSLSLQTSTHPSIPSSDIPSFLHSIVFQRPITPLNDYTETDQTARSRVARPLSTRKGGRFVAQVGRYPKCLSE